MNKTFILADIKDLINKLDLEEISMSRFTEVLNEKADAACENTLIEFEKWRIDNGYNIRNNGKYAIYYMGQGNHTFNELYKLYKNR